MMNAKEATFKVLDRYIGGDFFGHSLAFDVMAITEQQTYIATLLRYMREYRQERGVKITCINKRKSLYRMER